MKRKDDTEMQTTLFPTEQVDETVSPIAEVEEPAEEAVPVVDPRNTLNDLTGREWLPETKSFFFQKGLGAKHPHAQIERQHPAPYSFQDVMRLITFSLKLE